MSKAMRLANAARIAVAAVLVGIPSAVGNQAVPAVPPLVLRQVNVLPMDVDVLLDRHTVVVENGRVTQLGRDDEIDAPDGARVVDASGSYLLPGLVDAHVHLRDTTELPAYLAHGVTTVFQLSGPQGTIPDLRRLRDEIASRQRLGPRLILGGRLIDGDPPIFGNAADVVVTPAQGRAIVSSRRADGYDFVKIYNNVQREVLSAILDEAHTLDMLVFGHVPRGEGGGGGRARSSTSSLSAWMSSFTARSSSSRAFTPGSTRHSTPACDQ